MYSPNAAYEAGRRLGRRHSDVWISEDELVALVSREILPQVRPRNAQLTREADQFFSYAVVFAVLTVVSTALLVTINVFGSEAWIPEFLLQLPDGPVRWAPVVLAPVTLILWIGYWTANTRAVGERRRLRRRLARAAYKGAAETLTARRDKEINDRTTTTRKSGSARETAPKPSVHFTMPSARAPEAPIQIYRTITPRDAEELAAHWMRSMGAVGVEVTRFQGDGGIDVTSIGYIAQVKHFATNVGVAPIRELSGVVRADGRRGLFFATNGYSPGAVDFADISGIALFRMHPEKKELTAMNTTAKAFLKHGLRA
ncbi:MAG: restriction endonuclease [Propionibacteriaceae bacterium]|nr:restriction endonuclease [Propionibacteriaceae bacterium]